jgi:hypothetical protein
MTAFVPLFTLRIESSVMYCCASMISECCRFECTRCLPGFLLTCTCSERACLCRASCFCFPDLQCIIVRVYPLNLAFKL